ncbi:MAG: hypothetical protein CL693_13655 [Cellvibrionaceae bacterium]|nr:hypothetical protein [Cellvibrionaceae bacterium]|tara:strand:- start:8267 stop:8476 length:210 start_codon:yes stop_codon:yes gene_type:complete
MKNKNNSHIEEFRLGQHQNRSAQIGSILPALPMASPLDAISQGDRLRTAMDTLANKPKEPVFALNQWVM